MSSYRLGIDVGGTFTDAVLVDEDTGEIRRGKVLSTPEDQSEGTMAALATFGISPSEVQAFCHGSTVGINALIQRNGATTGLICTQGTRELLDMGRLRRPLGDDLYDPSWQRSHQARPLVHRRHVREVSARMLADGETYVELDEDEVRAQAQFLREEGVESVAICLLHSWKNLDHEERIRRIVKEELPDAYVQWSAVRPVYGEYNRTLSVVLDAYTGPLIARYLERLERRLTEDGFPGQVLIMQMNGGTRTLEETVRRFPAYMIESGPVAGVLGAEHYARQYLDTNDLICMDIGGTSTDIALVVDGGAQVTDEWEFEFSMPLGVPAVDVRSLGAGGGSIISRDDMGTLRVGPESAGASPGPAAYGRGGTLPTITDAYVALGVIQPSLFLQGELEVDREAALAALAPVAESLRLDPLELATGAIQLMNVHIENEISKIAFEQAVDLRDYSLLAYGGAGAIHAAQVTQSLGLREAIIPFFPGGFSALGMVTAPVKVERATSVIEPLDEVGAVGLTERFQDLEAGVNTELDRQGVTGEDIDCQRVIYGMYEGQSFDNRLPIKVDGELTDGDLEGWKEEFHSYYERIYGYSAREMGIIATTLSVTGVGRSPGLPLQELELGTADPPHEAFGLRTTVHMEGTEHQDVPFVRRELLKAGNRISGPAVIDDGLSTILVPPAARATIDRFGGIHIGYDTTEKSYFQTAPEVEERYGIDLITAETLRSGFVEASRHMRDTLMRSAFSNVVRENLDMGTSIHLIEPEGTEMVAITEGACHFAFTHPHMVNLVIDEWGLDNLGPGDTIICNDTWRGAIHFPDVNLFRPIFWEGEPLFILSDASHIVDIGGPVPGGFNNQAKTYYEEGLRIPPMLITSGDVPVRSTINLLIENTRTPLHNLGDVRALFGTMKVGEERVVRLLQRYGAESVKAAARYTLDLAERRMRRAIEEVPDGTFFAEETLDDDGVTGKPVRIVASARVAGDHVEIDYSGSDRQPVGATVTCWEETNRCLIGAKLILDRRHPMNSGAMRPFHVIAPPGSVVMGLPPTSASNHPEIATKVSALFVELFGQMMPENAVATESGTTHIHIIGGVDERVGREGRPFGGVITGGAAWGGTSTNDGISFNVTPIFNVQDNVLELLERDNPILLRNRNLVIDAAGPGRFRSGYSACFIIECLDGQSEISFSALLDSGRFHRRGLNDGGFGMTSYIFKVRKQADRSIRELHGVVPLEDLEPLAGLLDAEGRPDPADGTWFTSEEVPTLKIADYMLKEGEALYVMCATGGGYGNPLDREVESVRLDVWNEKLTAKLAGEIYGVVVNDGGTEVDAAATGELRGRLRAERKSGESTLPVGTVTPWPLTWDEWRGRWADGTRRGG